MIKICFEMFTYIYYISMIQIESGALSNQTFQVTIMSGNASFGMSVDLWLLLIGKKRLLISSPSFRYILIFNGCVKHLFLYLIVTKLDPLKIFDQIRLE